MIERCEDPDCPWFGQQEVDRGYRYPVCPSTKMHLNPKPMNPVFEGKYNKEEK